MLTLAFDTTADCCSIVLLQDNKVIEKFSEEMDFGQAETLLPQIQNILQKQNLTFETSWQFVSVRGHLRVFALQ